MEGFCEAMGEEGDISCHEKAKRKVKTPAQVDALEKFYNEHKYPSEAMKMEFAERVGLSEKQVSGWFCHRRQKEKKLLQGELKSIGKKNLSSSALHDGISGIRQESCCSTKQADRNLDSKEVESKMFYGCESSSVMFECQGSNQHAYLGDYHVSDNRSSGSSSASLKRSVQKAENIRVTQPSRCSIWADGNMLMSNINAKGDSKRHPVNSRYPFLQDESENHAISAVKWKLGRNYREDGPQLAIEFDPLPPDAFDSPIHDTNCDQYYIGSTRHEASSMYRSMNEPKMFYRYRLQEPVIKSIPEQRGFERTKQRLNDCNEIRKLQSTQKTFSSSHTDHSRSQIFGTDVDEDFAEEQDQNGRSTRNYFGNQNEIYWRNGI
ncbi:hypothetical protein AXF42_Ash008909 [Apostasia shenzhenica]|uniref:Homeobox domain-containing protein n=1 Tax=Apostasia shenzhenica TaxID=1088818 RepID=A0A2I0ASU7_9ASPA|nr:hypothetical protein AXF42_Ash008909 [Apostasia shenzhenica]